MQSAVNDNQLGTLCWRQGDTPPAWGPQAIALLAGQIRQPLYVLRDGATRALGLGVRGELGLTANDGNAQYECIGQLPAMYPEWLGDRGFCELHGVRFPYVAGAMARGIASIELVVAMGKAGMMGFFGSAGLPLERVTASIHSIASQLGPHRPWGCNLIHTPEEPALEASMVQCFLENGVTRISASAFMGLSPALATYAYRGVTQDDTGNISRCNYVFAKISRPETAAAFLNPAPAAMLQALVERGLLTQDEAALGARLPVAEDITVEADSGGHTDNQILTALFPSIAELRDRCVERHGYTRAIRIGAAGGLGTPSAIAAAYTMGAAYVLTGSVNQCSLEADVSAPVKDLLTQVRTGDVTMAPCADMFEAGVKVQVLKRRTLYAVRASKLYELYKRYDSLEAIPQETRQQIEQQWFRQSLDDIWNSTQAFFRERNPAELAKADGNPRHRMALVFRWYLGQSSRWPIVGDTDRVTDYQVWCGPAMASFNDWVKGSYLEPLENRSAQQIARNLLEGAALITRAQQLRNYGLAVPQSAFHYQAQLLS
jgi:trans-AT polyketide synthase/acyltransferase/oxidoreductase domain-containing protein